MAPTDFWVYVEIPHGNLVIVKHHGTLEGAVFAAVKEIEKHPKGNHTVRVYLAIADVIGGTDEPNLYEVPESALLGALMQYLSATDAA